MSVVSTDFGLVQGPAEMALGTASELDSKLTIRPVGVSAAFEDGEDQGCGLLLGVWRYQRRSNGGRHGRRTGVRQRCRRSDDLPG